MRHRQATAIAVALVLLLAGCRPDGGANADQAQGGAGAGNQRDLPQGSEPVKLDPADFSTNIDNPYWPMAPGDKWVYSETDTVGGHEKSSSRSPTRRR